MLSSLAFGILDSKPRLKGYFMHPLRAAVEAALEAGLDFLIEVGGDRAMRLRMGFPPMIADRQPLLLTFPAGFHKYSMPSGDDYGLHCLLSFDSLHNCQIPWSTVRQFVIHYSGDDSWPVEWEEDAAEDAKSDARKTSQKKDDARSIPDNVRQFKPRAKRK